MGKVNPTTGKADDYGREREATPEEIEEELRRWAQLEKEADKDVKAGNRS